MSQLVFLSVIYWMEINLANSANKFCFVFLGIVSFFGEATDIRNYRFVCKTSQNSLYSPLAVTT